MCAPQATENRIGERVGWHGLLANRVARHVERTQLGKQAVAPAGQSGGKVGNLGRLGRWPSAGAGLAAARNVNCLGGQGLTAFGPVADRSVSFRNFPKLSVSFRSVPEFSAVFRFVPLCSGGLGAWRRVSRRGKG